MKMKNLNIGFIAIAAGMLVLTSCYKKKNSPGWEYMAETDMYRQSSYRAYESNPNFQNGLTMQNQVEGTIPHSFDREKMINYMPFPYGNDSLGLANAKVNLKNPLTKSAAHLAEGERLFKIYCNPCHGAKGKGDGSVVKILDKRGNMALLPPAYDSDQLKGISEGQIFYATQYGKGNMGPYAPLLSAYERWEVVMFVQTLQGGGTATTDSTNTTTH
jgi:mono/diheme cytochrome c family protein